MSWTLPKYIGHPGYEYTPDGPSNKKLFEEKLDSTLLIANITPLEPKMESNINIYSGRNAWGDFVKYLDSNGISPGEQKGKLKVVINNITPITESYNNEFGPSELESTVNNVIGNNMRDLAFATGFNGKSNLEKMKNGSGIEKAVGNAWSGISSLGEWAGGKINDQFGKDLGSFMSNPAQKIDIPQMWKGNSFNCSFEISVRLFCFSPKNDKYFGDYILAPLGALMQFAAPKSEQGKFYTWPFMMSFQIPGLIHIPLAYCSSLTDVKGGDNNDLSYIHRPGMIDVRMTINSVFGVRVNALGGGDGKRPTIKQELESMANLKEETIPQEDKGNGGSSSGSGSLSTSRNNELSDTDSAAIAATT